MSYPRKSLIECGQELHDASAELWAVLRDFIRPVVAATVAGLAVLLKKKHERGRVIP